MDTSEIHSGMIHERVDKVANQNSRKRLYITARSMFKDLGICQDLPYLEGEGKIYDIPSQEDLEWLIARSKYRFTAISMYVWWSKQLAKLVRLRLKTYRIKLLRCKSSFFSGRTSLR